MGSVFGMQGNTGQTLSYPHEFDEKSDSKQFVTK